MTVLFRLSTATAAAAVVEVVVVVVVVVAMHITLEWTQKDYL